MHDDGNENVTITGSYHGGLNTPSVTTICQQPRILLQGGRAVLHSHIMDDQQEATSLGLTFVHVGVIYAGHNSVQQHCTVVARYSTLLPPDSTISRTKNPSPPHNVLDLAPSIMPAYAVATTCAEIIMYFTVSLISVTTVPTTTAICRQKRRGRPGRESKQHFSTIDVQYGRQGKRACPPP